MSGVDLVQWLGVQLDEDERIARKAGGRSEDGYRWFEIDGVKYPGAVGTERGLLVTTDKALREHAAHIAEHDPARVLREIEGARELLGRYEALAAGVLVMTGAEAILSEYRRVILPNLALPYADRPGYVEALASVQ